MSESFKYEVVIGLEVHIQLATKSKLFCADANRFGAEGNENISAFTLALPGTLPVLNKEAVQLAIKLGIACNSTINQLNYFARKHYFYPDSPKGFQTTQDEKPIIVGGSVPIEVNGAIKNIEIHHAHMEEDAGKSLHDQHDTKTYVDLNRAGTPLIELVTMPCIHSADEAAAFVLELRRMVRWLGISDGNMEEGSIRADVNVSLRLKGETKLGTRVEVKNVNSVRFIKKAIECEVERIAKKLDNGETILQETRGFDANTGITYALREKEDANDYRYMPEPDLPAIIIEAEEIEKVTQTLEELPWQKQQRYVKTFGFNNNLAKQLTEEKNINTFFEQLATKTNAKQAANFTVGAVQTYCNENNIAIETYPITIEKIAEIITLVESKQITHQIATTKLLPALYDNADKKVLAICEELELLNKESGNDISTLISEVLNSMPDKVVEYRKGKKGLIGLFTGQVMKKTKGMGDAKMINELLLEKLNEK
jgi:aspartyl-tRNA(Asn)/glutamyl-tRNA(Gln) amidotransferase subunit B